MGGDGKLMDMLTGYAASHQHPFNIFVHMIGIPTIMFGILIPLTWASTDIAGISLNLAHVVMVGFFLFYLTLDTVFAIVFLVIALIMTEFAGLVGEKPTAISGTVAAIAFSAAISRSLWVTRSRSQCRFSSSIRSRPISRPRFSRSSNYSRFSDCAASCSTRFSRKSKLKKFTREFAF